MPQTPARAIPSRAAAIRYLTRAILALRASRVRWWYQRARAWWRRLQSSQCPAWPGGRGLGEQAGDLGDGQRDHAGAGWWRLAGPDRGRGLGIGAGLSRAAVMAQMATAAMTSTVCRAIAV